jgi:DNA-directed RNA polymerase subunit L
MQVRVRIKKINQDGVVVDVRKRQWSLNNVIYDILLDDGKIIAVELDEIDLLEISNSCS